MAYVRGVYRYTSGTGPHVMDDMPEHVTGTLLIWHIASSVTPMLTTALAAGWALHPTYTPTTVNSVRQNWLYKIATSDSETPPQLDNTGTGYVNQTVVSVEDYDTVNIFDVQDKTSNTAVETIALPTPTTTVDECLVLDAFAIYNAAVNLRPYFIKTEVQHLVREVGNRIAIAIGYRVQRTAGALPAATGYCSTSAYYAGTASCITIRNKSGGTLPAYAVQHYTKLLEECRLDSAINTALGVSGVNTYDTITTIGAFAVENRAFALAVGTPTDTTYKCHHHAYTATVTTGSLWSGQGIQWSAPIDLTNRALSFNWSCSDRARMGTEGCIVVLESSAGNWTAFNLRRLNAILTSAVYTAVIDSTSSVYASAGTTDFSSIVRIHWLYRRTSTTNQSLSVFGLRLVDRAAPCIIVGGGANQPINAERIAAIGNSHDGGNSFTIAGSPIGLGGQMVMRLPVQIGNGTIPSYYDVAGQSFEVARRRFVPARIFDFDVGEGIVGMDFKACGACVMNDKASILASTDGKLHYRLLSGTSSADVYDFDAKQILNGTVTWDSGVEASGILFAKCNEVDGKAAEFTRCTFDQATVSGSNSALKLDDGGKALSCIFNAADAGDYAVRIDAAGTYTLDGSTFSGYTTPIKVTATTGTVTIHMALGQTAPAYSSDGATVVFDIPTVSATGSVNGMVAGGRLFIFNETTAAEMANAIQAGTSYSASYQDGTGYTAGDTILMRFRKPGYEDIEARTTATSGGWSFTIAPVVDPHTTLTSPANITVDYVNKKIRATGARTTITAQELVDIITNAEATEDGIRLPAFAEISGLVELTPGVFTALTVELIDWQASWAAGSVSQAYLTSGNIVGGLAGDVVEDVVGGPQVTIMLAQSGTTIAVGSGVLPADITAIAAASSAAILAAAETTPIHADAKKLNGATVIGTGSTGDAWRGVGVAP